MNYNYNETLNHISLYYKPRLIIWEIIDSSSRSKNKLLTTQQCFQVLDSIAEISKPIIVLSTNHFDRPKLDPLDRPDIKDIIIYGKSIGLKMIVETSGDRLSKDLRDILKTIGTKSIRILINDKVKESIEYRYLNSSEYLELDKRLNNLLEDGFEIQLGIALNKIDKREVAFAIDYSIRKNAKGIYLQLMSTDSKINGNEEDIITWIAQQKKLLPDEMYFSPQCIRYGIKHEEDEGHHNHYSERSNANQITHWCLGGKTFTFINASGKVQICKTLKKVCGDLTQTNFNFCKIWNYSIIFKKLRDRNYTCPQTQNFIMFNSTLEYI